MESAIVVNFSSCNGAAKRKWYAIEKKLLKKLPEKTIIIPFSQPCNLKETLRSLVRDFDIKNFIAAGGDGTINCLLNDLISITGGKLENFRLGAVGLGSSNDFHKPVSKTINGIPVKIDFRNCEPSDLGQVIFRNCKGETNDRFFLINASLGFTAEGNQFFNKGDRIIRRLKPYSVSLAILYTTLKTLMAFRNVNLEIHEDYESGIIKATNLSLTIKPYISGNFMYECSNRREIGKLGLYVTENHSRFEILKLLYDLTKGKFNRKGKRHSCQIEKISVLPEGNVSLETDGEVFSGDFFRFLVVPHSIQIAT